MLLPALSRAEPEFFIRTSAGKARRKAAIPSAFFLFDEKQIDISISESVFLTLLISPPSSSLSFSGKGYAPYLNVGRHSGILLFEPRVNIGSNMIGGVLATPCVQYKKKASGKLQRLQKEGAFLCCTEKRTKEKTLFDFLSSSRARLSPARPALEGKISKAEKDRGRGSSILFSSRSGSEKHSEGARPSFRWQKQKRSNPFGASGNPKTNSVYFFHR